MPEAVTYTLTVPEMAERLGKPVHVVNYFIRSRRIQPMFKRVGNIRQFSFEQCDQIGQALSAQEAASAVSDLRRRIDDLPDEERNELLADLAKGE